MADKRAFAQFDVGYLDNPKIMEVFDESPIAILMHFASVLYCAQHLTDGVITAKPMQRKVGGTNGDADLLVERGLWHPPGHGCEYCPQPDAGKVYVHDYTEHNRTSGGVKRSAEAGKKGAAARWGNKNADPNANRMRTAYESHSDPQCDSDEIAMARERERKREREEAKASSSEPSRPDVEQVISSFSELLKANDVKHKPGQAWRTAARLLIDKDGYTPEQILYVARFATTDEFWKSNILSIPKLREKFEALKIKAQAHNNPQPQRMDHSARARAKEADMLARFNAQNDQPFLEIEG
ncbi:hypothetical protein ACFRJ8_14870 [Arthrobacter sp. NPDC056886]|uniref:hypothetical protein n=1 Tax=Arthrobacter sp. NPDC056886 TaxID=3345960 RepID=UPI00367274D6